MARNALSERYDFAEAGAALGDDIGRLALGRLHARADISGLDWRALAAEMAGYVTAGENALRRAGATAAEAAAFGDAATKRVSEMFARYRASAVAAKSETMEN